MSFTNGDIGGCACCPTCTVQISLQSCPNLVVQDGVTVAIPSLGLSAVTGLTGTVTFNITPGTYTITTSGNPRYTNTSASHALTCGQHLFITLSPGTGYACHGCFNGPVPNTLNYSMDGVTGTFTLSGGTANFCVTQPSANLLTYPFLQCVSSFATNPCTTTTGPGAKFAIDFSACTLEQQTWCGTDCNNTDATCTGQVNNQFVSSCTHFVPNFTSTGPCDCIWFDTSSVNHFGTTSLSSQSVSFGTGLSVPVNLTLTFTSIPLEACYPLFVTCDIFE